MPAIIPFIPLIAAGIAGGTAIGAAEMQRRQNNRALAGQLAAADRAGAREDEAFDKSITEAREQRDYDRWLTEATAKARQPYLDELFASLDSGGGGFRPVSYEPGTYEAAQPFKAPDPKELLTDPGYQFELAEGGRAVERSGISRGTFLTGGTGKELEGFGHGLAATRGKERYDRALGEYSLAETLRAQAYDRNEANRFNAAQLSQQGAIAAANLADSAAGRRISALGTAAGLALPVGTFPGSRTPADGGQRTLPVPFTGGGDMPLDIADMPNFSATNPNPISPFAPPTRPRNPDEDEWSGALARRTF